MNFDLVKFAKLLEMSSSSYDQEALTAIRKANTILLENNMTWTQWVSSKNITIQEIVGTVQTPTPTQGSVDIQTMLDECIQYVGSPSGKQFILSLNDWYKRNGNLTSKQEEALKRWYANL